ncbi:MAG: pentapeptide repeat-containing protein [Polyangiaceae bacterium]|nr:pentapeptide repeat-containing protein [Polyangiaceae bacterium]
MHVFKPQYLTPLFTVFDDGKRLHCVVTAMFMTSFGGALGEEIELWGFASEDVEGGVIDEGMPKTRGEFLVHGACYAYDEQTTQSFVKARVGPVEKLLAVFGERTLGVAGPSSPKPFSRVPITFANAFGGNGYADNPNGKGYRGSDAPQVELRSQLMKSQGDRPKPAGYGRVDAALPERSKRMGTYDDKWFKTRYPGVAEDFDGSYFQISPEDQWFPDFFEGRETFEAVNMHASRSTLEGKLPGVIPRCFIRKRAEDDFQDVALRIDTVHLFPHRERALVVARGTLPTRSDTLSDIDKIVCGLEWMGRPKSKDHYLEVFAARSDKKTGLVASLDDRPLLPEDAVLLPKFSGGMPKELQGEDFAKQRLERGFRKEHARIQKEAAEHGLEVPDLPPMPSTTVAPEGRAFESESSAEQIKASMDEALEKACGVARQMAESHGKDPEQAVAELKKGQVGPPAFSRDAKRKELEEQVALFERGGADASSLKAQLENPKFEAFLVEVETFVKESYRRTVQAQGVAPPLGDSQHIRAFVQARLDSKESLANMDLTGVDLSNLDLRGADFTRSMMESANLKGAQLEGAIFDHCVFARASFDKPDFAGARVRGANFSECDLTGANFAGCDLSESFFVRSNLTDANLADTVLVHADLGEAKLVGTRFDRSSSMELALSKTKLENVSMAYAKWKQCTFVECDLVGVQATGAEITEANWVDVVVTDGRFDHANLENLRAARIERGASFIRCSFLNADVRRSHFRGAKIDTCDFSFAQLDETDFSEAIADGSKFDDARAQLSRYMAASLKRCTFHRADLLEALFGGAIMDHASFEDANLYRADMGRVGGDKVSMKGANVKRVRTIPRREGDV